MPQYRYNGSPALPLPMLKVVRAPTVNKAARKLTDAEVRQVMRLGCMRIWSLKEKLETERHLRDDLASKLSAKPEAK